MSSSATRSAGSRTIFSRGAFVALTLLVFIIQLDHTLISPVKI